MSILYQNSWRDSRPAGWSHIGWYLLLRQLGVTNWWDGKQQINVSPTIGYIWRCRIFFYNSLMYINTVRYSCRLMKWKMEYYETSHKWEPMVHNKKGQRGRQDLEKHQPQLQWTKKISSAPYTMKIYSFTSINSIFH